MKLFIQLGWFFRQQGLRYVVAISLLVAVAILQLIPPKIVGVVVDGIDNQSISSVELVKWVGVMVIIALAVYILRYFWRLVLYGASYQLAVILRQRCYLAISQQFPAFFLRYRTGDLIARATNDVDRVVFAAGEGILTLVDSLIMGCAVLIVMSTQISWQLTLFTLLPMPVMALLINYYGSRLHVRFRFAQEAFSNLSTKTQDVLTSIRMIKAFGLEHYQAQLFAQVTANVGQENMRVARIDALFNPTISIFIAFSSLLAITGGSWMIARNLLTLGQLTSFIMYLGLMIWPMLALAWMFNIVERGSAAYQRLIELFNEQSDMQDGNLEIVTGQGELTVKIEKFVYPKSVGMILQQIFFQIQKGQMLGICGPTGAGKTTLLALLQRQFDVTQGEITYQGVSLRQLQLSLWRSRIAVVNQTSFLFSATVAENIALGIPTATPQQIEHAARLACIHEDIERFPNGYATEVGERGVMLSGGQKQRIAIARALLLNTEILILDDALSAVDGKTEYAILMNLQQWRGKRTIIISTHRLSAIVKADEILVLQEGGISQRGTHEYLLNQQGWYNRMYYYQQIEAELEGSEGENDEPASF